MGMFSASVIVIGAWQWLLLPLLCLVSVRKWERKRFLTAVTEYQLFNTVPLLCCVGERTLKISANSL